MLLLERISKWFLLENDEKAFLEKSFTKHQNGVISKRVLIQLQVAPIFIERIFNFSKRFKNPPLLLDTSKPHYSKIDILFFPIVLIKIIEQFFLRRKIKQLNRKLFVGKVYSHNLYFFKFLPKAINLFWNLKSKDDFLNLKYGEILIGDLLYDTYLRFFKKGTLNIKDYDLVLLLARTFSEIEFLEKLSKQFDVYLTGYCTYTNSGLPVRVFLHNNVDVYSFSNIKTGKKLSTHDYFQVKPHWNYRSIFSLIEHKKEKIEQGLILIENRINGNMDLDYMKHNPYQINSNIASELVNSFDGVVFLHDFTDSYNIYRNSVFRDFLEWTEFTFDLIIKNNLNIGIKPHPNQNETSKKITAGLIKKYTTLNWINEKVSNNTIFESGISFGISVYGTVLTELAFNGIIPISCGDNPTSNYNFVFNAKKIEEYTDLIINYSRLKLKNNVVNEIGEFMFMHYLYNKPRID